MGINTAKMPPGCCFVTVCSVIGIVILAIGAVFLSNYDPMARINGINKYNMAVYEWQTFGFSDGAYNEFVNAGPFRVTVDNPVWVNLTTSLVDPVPVEIAPEIETYSDTAAFVSTSSAITGPINWPANTVLTRTFNVYDKHNQFLFSRQIALGMYIDFTSTKKSGSSSYPPCGRGTRQGSTSTCRMYFAVGSEGVCIVVNPTTMQYAGKCSIVSSDAAEAAVYSSGDLIASVTPNRLFDAAYDYYSSQPATVAWNNYPITIRSSADPWVVAAVETEGNMVFGGKDDELKTRGTILVAVGGAILGLLFSFFCCIVLLAFRDKFRFRGIGNSTFNQQFKQRYAASMKPVTFNTAQTFRNMSKRFGAQQNAYPPPPTTELPAIRTVATPPPMTASHPYAPQTAGYPQQYAGYSEDPMAATPTAMPAGVPPAPAGYGYPYAPYSPATSIANPHADTSYPAATAPTYGVSPAASPAPYPQNNDYAVRGTVV